MSWWLCLWNISPHIPLCWKVTDELQVTFAVEAVAASQARDLAQEVCRWQGRVFLPLLRAVGLGSFAGELPPDKAQRPRCVGHGTCRFDIAAEEVRRRCTDNGGMGTGEYSCLTERSRVLRTKMMAPPTP